MHYSGRLKMTSEEIAARFDDRPGFRLVDFGDIGLPIYKLTVTALLLAKKNLSPIEEFVLRAVSLEFTRIIDISSLLGLGETTVKAALANLIRSEDIFELIDGSVSLTSKGQRTIQTEVSVVSREGTVVFYYDGLTRKPQWFSDSMLYSPKQADAAGIRQIRAFPARKPSVEELDINAVYDTLRRVVKVFQDNQQILRITQLRFAQRFFLRGIILVYKSLTDQNIQVGFAIDGRKSEDHEMAFVKANGAKLLGIEDAVLKTNIEKEKRDAFGVEKSNFLIELTRKSESKAADLQNKVATAKFVVEVAEEKLELATNENETVKAEKDLNIAKIRVDKFEKTLRDLPVRPVPVYEHAKLLHDAIKEATSRLLIISPWITPTVVDQHMINSIRSLLERRVGVFIGYGISVEPDERDGNKAINDLIVLAKKFENLKFVRMGDTHAKVLIKDSDFYVITSFNWLSFKGDPKRTFREEWGTYVGINEQVNEYFRELQPRFMVCQK